MISLMLIMCLAALFDESQGYLQGPLRALGLQTKAAVLCIISYWIFALPLAAVFAFKMEKGVFGLWYGIGTGAAIEMISYITLLWWADWE